MQPSNQHIIIEGDIQQSDLASITSDTKYVKFKDCRDVDWDAITQQLSKRPALEVLLLPACRISDTTAPAFAKLSNIFELDLSSNDIGRNGAKAISKLSQLKVLNLSDNRIDNEAARELAQLKNLVALNLNYNQLDNKGAGEFKNNKNLKELSLIGNKISAEEIEQLRKQLPETKIEFR